MQVKLCYMYILCKREFVYGTEAKYSFSLKVRTCSEEIRKFLIGQYSYKTIKPYKYIATIAIA